VIHKSDLTEFPPLTYRFVHMRHIHAILKTICISENATVAQVSAGVPVMRVLLDRDGIQNLFPARQFIGSVKNAEQVR
jgi:hypothetical protein